jgi:hypothetical protein
LAIPGQAVVAFFDCEVKSTASEDRKQWHLIRKTEFDNALAQFLMTKN